MLETREYNLPLPYPGPDDQAFWEGTKRHELLIQRCTGCGALRFWGKPMCAECNSFDSEAVPYTVVVVQLDEGSRLTSNLVNSEPEAIRVGLPVEVVFDDVTPEITLPKFRLA